MTDTIPVPVDLANNILRMCDELVSDGDSQLGDTADALRQQLNALMIKTSHELAAAASERQLTASQARRVAGTAKKAMDEQSALVGERLLGGRGMDEYCTIGLMRAQADWPFYVLIANQPDLDTEGVLALLAEGCAEARRILNGGRESTSSIDRAFMEYERRAATKFLSAWGETA